MKKLFTLKKWLTLQETAAHLSIVFGEEICVADVLRLALDEHLKLSVNFVNLAKAREGKVVPIEDAEYVDYPSEFFPNVSIPEEHIGKPIQVMRGINLDNKHVLNLGNEVLTLDGVYDLAMLGSERLFVEHEYQMLTNGPSVTLMCMQGAFVNGEGNVMYQIQERFHRDKSDNGLKQLKADLQADDPKNPNTRKILGEYLEKLQQTEVKKKRTRGEDPDDYYPAANLPEDCVMVVRTDALREFEQLVNGAREPNEKPMTATERNTLLTIIAALCDYSVIDPKARGTAKQIASMTEELGAPVTDETILKALVKIPDAVERRMKVERPIK